LVDGIPLAIAGLFSKGSMAFKHWSKVVRLQLTVDCADPVADEKGHNFHYHARIMALIK
jgi:hypothetical protein